MAASLPDEAKSAFTTPLPFMPSNGALGILMAATTTSGTSSRTALVGHGSTLVIVNDGSYSASVALGDSSVTATTAHMLILAGTSVAVAIPQGRSLTEPTYAAAITATGTTSIQITRGYGV